MFTFVAMIGIILAFSIGITLGNIASGKYPRTSVTNGPGGDVLILVIHLALLFWAALLLGSY